MISLLLRKIEAYGFKSFAEKTEIELGTGITAIVGPNGSGKSNIADAVRWALGEQSLKSLRGAKSEDVIFSGSQGRRALGIAEVSLFFDNSDGVLPLDYHEVVITRRIFRSGDSEYYINKTACRLKDIHELFADTGVGRDSMMVIGQNKIDEILNAKPEERRLLFEEAAGITKYKQRKRDALKKIEETEQNVVRLQDITAELESQLGPLAESAEKTKQYNELHGEWLSYQVSQLLRRIRKAREIQEAATQDHSAFFEQETVLQSQQLLAETEREKKTSELAASDESYRDFSRKLSEIETKLQQLEANIGVLHERQDQGNREFLRLTGEQENLSGKLQENQQKLQEVQTAYDEKVKQQQELRTKLSTAQQAYEQTDEQTNSLREKIETGKEQVFSVMQELVKQKNFCRDYEKELALTAQQQNGRQRQLNEQQEALKSLEEAARQEAAVLQDCYEKQQSFQLLEKNLHVEEQHLVQKIAQEKTETEKRQRILNGSLAKRNVLQNMQHDLEGFSRGAKSLLRHDVHQMAIRGAVAQLIHVPTQVVTAIEIALGGAAQYLITDTAAAAKHAIQYLKQNHLGRVTFLPLDTVQAPMRRDMELKAAQEPGVLGFAADLVTYDQAYDQAIQQVLGRTLIVETIDQGLAVAKKYRHMLRLVTLEGELLNPGGSLTGGSLQRRENSFLGRQGEIERLSAQIAREEQDLKCQHQKAEQVQGELLAAREKLAACQKDKQNTEVRLAEVKVRSQQSRQEVQRLHAAIRLIQEGITAAEAQVKRVRDELAAATQEVTKLEKQDQEAKAAITEWQAASQEQQQQVTRFADEVTTLKIDLAALEQGLQGLTDHRAIYQTTVTQMMQELAEVAAKRETAEETARLTDVSLTDCIQQKQQLTEEKTATEQKLHELYEQKMNLMTAVRQEEQNSKEIRKKLQDVQGKLHERELLMAKYETEVTTCENQLTEQFHLTESEAQSYYVELAADELVTRIRRLEQSIAELGPIHAGAIEEYNKLSERYQFLKQQYEDLIAAKSYLVSIVQEIDQTMGQQFKKAFDEINEYFCQIFVKLFGGGQARLTLQSPQELLTTGIEILVQPPGKKQQYLSLFSGGERSLTVIALLFSLLSYRPAPFCIVDEIDAALDEANVNRFSEFLREYAGHTQFIVVTHRKGTMEVADVMHGITMEESGVSKVISVKFSEKAG